MDELISIIIPVFNVKKYLDRCMLSVLNQTYTNLEIIIVDDGSTDGSGALCDLWSSKDNRIKVIHKENEGVAAARNDALAIAKGDYIGFADPDDWMDNTMFEVLLNVIKRFSADIVICGFEEVNLNNTRIKQVDYTRCYTRDEALYELVRDEEIQNYVWNKLFRRKCVPLQPFPKIKSISDLAGTYRFFQKAETVVHINRSLYHYIHREGSLVGKDGTMESSISYCLAKQLQFDGLCNENVKIRGLAADRYIRVLEVLKRRPVPSDSVQAENCFQVIKSTIFPFYISHLTDFRAVKDFTTEKERDISLFLKNPVKHFDNLRTKTSNGHTKKAIINGNSKKELTKEKFKLVNNKEKRGISAVLSQSIKNFLKRFIPPPTNVFNREINRILSKNEKQYQGIEVLIKETDKKNVHQISALSALVKQTDEKSTQQISALSALVKQTDDKNTQQVKNLEKQLEDLRKENDSYKLMLASMEDRIQKMQIDVSSSKRHASEAVWADIFNNVICDSPWLKNIAFSAGRWAVGYQYLYVMYRVLNEIHPQHILELGLGQSTRMIGQYVSSHKDAEHFVVEHDPEWIDFFSRDFALSERSIIIKLDREIIPFKEAEAVRVFKGFEEHFSERKFDFISIDAPFGGDMKQYARIDVLKLLPGCLADSFIIMIDDTERSGETNTVNAMRALLKQTGIAFATGRYSGDKDCTVICSENLKFVCSM